MKKNKKILVLAMLLALSLNACGRSNNNADETTPTPTETPIVQENTTEQGTGDENLGMEGGLDQGEDIYEDTTLTSNEQLDTFHQKVKEMYGENYIPSMPYDAVMLEEVFGIKPEWYDAAIAEGPMMSAHVDKLIAIHATEGNFDNVKNALETYRETIVNDTMNYPMNLNRIQGSVVDTAGNYVIFAMVGYIDEMQYEQEDEMIAAYEKENKKVIDTAKEVLGK